MATIKPARLIIKGLTLSVGLFCVLNISGCQTGKSPEAVTGQFWQSLAAGKLAEAKTFASLDSEHLVNIDDIDKNSPVTTGEAIVDDNDATVQTTITRHKKTVTFDTVLRLETGVWKVDYLKTEMNISMLPLNDVVKSLQNLGGVFAKELEKQIPSLQKEMESLGEELKKQIDEFGRSLDNSQIPPTKKPSPGSI